MRRVGQVRRRDGNEKDIRLALAAVGAETTPVSGKGAPDLLVRHGSFPDGFCKGIEVKAAKGIRTEAQEVSQWPIVRSVEDALSVVGIVAGGREPEKTQEVARRDRTGNSLSSSPPRRPLGDE